MDERSAIAVMSGARRDVVAKLLRGLCRLVSAGYATAVRLRNAAYDRGWFRVHRATVPVISVGNITTGGTGKTPIVAWLVEELMRRGYRPGILSRGYRSLDGRANDEALVLERMCPGTPHIQNRDRVAGAQIAIAEHGCDVLVLDDGYQHRRLHRDLDILLIDALRPWGFGAVLPRGLLREPLSSLWRSDVILITRAEPNRLPVALSQIEPELRRHRGHAAATFVRFIPQGWIAVNGESQTVEMLMSERVVAFCGIGNPEGLAETLAQLTTVVELRTFPDHHHYSAADLDELERWRRESGVNVLVTTLKDLVKIPVDHPIAERTLAVEIRGQLTSGADHVTRALDSICPLKGAIRHAA
ncbi:MAG: tetraacyldisaccharide 4'-kinase [Planctomycetales bacterium 12-60-4]|nr:MAG: tetraacyldisaccharide 4'-kinase [Planctomycetales bacterium 12-60-4]